MHALGVCVIEHVFGITMDIEGQSLGVGASKLGGLFISRHDGVVHGE